MRQTDQPEYAVWHGMIARCEQAGREDYARYGGRGISVCAAWRKPFKGFLQFLADTGRRPSPRHQLDRIDSDGNYEPSNCRWVLPEENARNMRSNKLNGVAADLIRYMWRRGAKQADIAHAFGIAQSHVSHVVTGRSWYQAEAVQP